MSTDTTSSTSLNQWEEATVKLQQKRQLHGAVVLPDNNILITGGFSLPDNKILITGGFSHSCFYLASTEVININNNTTESTTMPDLPSERGDHASVIVNNDAYIIGGSNGSSVQRINVNDPQTGWQNEANMNQARSLCAAAVHNNTIFVFGGSDRGRRLSTVECFDTATNSNGEWNAIQSQMAVPRYRHTAVTVGDIIYIIGGNDSYNRLNSIEMFDTSSRTFQQGPPLPRPIRSTSAVAVGKLIIVIGGYDGTNHQRIGESFVLDTTAPNPQWKIINIPLQTPRENHTAVLMNNDKLCVCGGFGGGFGGGNALDTLETISIVDLLPHDLLDMTALHALCCDPNVTVDAVRRLMKADPSALSHQDVTGRTPVQRFLLCRGLLGAGGENDNNNSTDDETEEEEEAEESLPSLYDLMENGINSNDLDILFVLKTECIADLLIRDEFTNLVPFMTAATMSECGLDVVYSLAMGNPDVLL